MIKSMQDVSNVDDNNIVSLKLKVKKTCKTRTNIVLDYEPMDTKTCPTKENIVEMDHSKRSDEIGCRRSWSGGNSNF